MPQIPGVSTDSTPAAAVMHSGPTGPHLYVAFKERNSDHIRIASTLDPSGPPRWVIHELPSAIAGSEPNQLRTSHAPALTQVVNAPADPGIGLALLLAFKGHNNPYIWLTRFVYASHQPGRLRFIGRGHIPDTQTAVGPAVAGRYPLVVHRGNRDDGIWYWWPPRVPNDRRISDVRTDVEPAVALWESEETGPPYAGRDLRAIIAFRDPSSDAIMFMQNGAAHVNIIRWTEPRQIPDAWSLKSPALAMHNGLMYIAFKSRDDDRIWIGSYDGRSWVLHDTVPHLPTSEGPTLVSFLSELYVVCKGADPDNSIWYVPVPVHAYTHPRVLEIPFRPNPNGFAFSNFSEGVPDWETFRDTFGHSEIDGAATAAGVDIALAGGVFYAWLFFGFYGVYCNFLNGSLARTFGGEGGMCAGMSSRSLFRYWRDPSSSLFSEFPSITHDIRREITVAQGRLLGTENLLDLLHQCEEGIARVRLSLEEIADDFRTGSGLASGRVLFFIPSRVWDEDFISRLVGTHAVVPYRIEYPGPGSSDSTIRLYVYDSNHPGNNGPGNPGFSVVNFTERADGEYDYEFRTGDDAGHLHTAFRSQDGFTLGTLTLHDYLRRDVDLPLSLGFIVDLVDSPVDLRIYDERGRLTGHKDGKIRWDIQGSAPLYPMPGAFLLPAGKYTREIVGKGDGPYTFCSFNPDGTGVLVHGTATGPQNPSLEKLVVEREGNQLVLHTDERSKNVTIGVRAVGESGVKVVLISDIQLERRKPVKISFTDELESLETEYEGTSHEIRTEVLHVAARGAPLRKAEIRADLHSREPLHLRMSFGETLLIEKQ